MQLTRTRTKYYLLSLLGALMVALSVLAMSPSAQAQQADPITVDKECSPNPVQVGQPLTCTIDVEPADPQTAVVVEVRDTFPAGVTVTGATQQQFLNGTVVNTVPCTVTGNTVVCPGRVVTGAGAQGPGVLTLRVTIDAIAQECGTFTNTAEAVVIGVGTVEDTEDITVVGCEESGGGAAGGVGGGGGGATPITQEGEQESEAGEIDQSFDVS